MSYTKKKTKNEKKKLKTKKKRLEFRVGLGAFASRGFLDGGAGVGVGPPAGQSISSDGADQGRVHHLGSMPQGQAVHQDFDRPRVLRGVIWGVGKVHLVEGDVGVHSAAGFSAYASDRAFKGAERGCAGSQRWGMHCGGHQTHPGGPRTGKSRL